MQIILFIVLIINSITLFWLCFPFLTLLASKFITKTNKPSSSAESDIACIITVYKNLDISTPLVRSILKQNYSHYHIYLVADQVPERIYPIDDARLTVIFPDTSLNSKVMSIHTAMNQFKRNHEFIAIFDPDNLAHPNFLSSINKKHQEGFLCVQGKRTAKNLDTPYAALDAMGEYYYDYTVRRVPYLLGSSSTIAGSGMSIHALQYRRNIENEVSTFMAKGIVVSEDKSLQLELVQSGIRIAYSNDAILFDEKVASADQVSRQRTRWLNSYFRHAADTLLSLMTGLYKLSWNTIFFSVVVLMPPMIILAGATLFLIFVNLFLNPTWAVILAAGGLVNGLSFLLALKLNRSPREIWNAIPMIPLFASRQILSLLKIRKANKDFLLTSHQHNNTFEEVWKKRKKDFE